MGAAERSAGDAGEHIGDDNGGDVGVHFVGHQHGKLHEILKPGTNFDHSGKAHQSGGQKQGIDAGEPPVDKVLYDMSLQIFVICENQNNDTAPMAVQMLSEALMALARASFKTTMTT